MGEHSNLSSRLGAGRSRTGLVEMPKLERPQQNTNPDQEPRHEEV